MNAPHHHLHKVELQTRDYKDNVTPFWCPGCGHHGVLTGVFGGDAIGGGTTKLRPVSGLDGKRQRGEGEDGLHGAV